MEKYISYRFGAGRYIQEPEVLENSGTEIARFGKRAYIIGGPNAMNAVAGAQNSIVVIPDEKLREKWDKYTLGHRVIGGNAFGYIATQAAYEGGEEWLTGIKAQIYDNYLYLKKELSEKLPEVIVTPLEGTYLCWVDLKAYVSEENIKDMIQKKCRLAVDYGDWFGGERFGTHIRINLATSHENVKIAVDALVDNI